MFKVLFDGGGGTLYAETGLNGGGTCFLALNYFDRQIVPRRPAPAPPLPTELPLAR